MVVNYLIYIIYVNAEVPEAFYWCDIGNTLN